VTAMTIADTEDTV